MEITRPHFSSFSRKSFKEFAFLKNSKHYLSKSFSFPDALGHIGDFEIHSKNLKNYKKLSKLLQDSKFGKGKSTKLDKEIRDSKEILAKHIKLTPEFSKEIQIQVDEMALRLNHPKQVECHLSKMVIYEEGGHFNAHIDTNHKPNMIFTLSVEIFVNEENEGGILKINNRFEVPSSTKEDELILALFYHDVLHEVTELTEGTRICLIFDVIDLENVAQIQIKEYEKEFKKGIQAFKKIGVKKFGVLADHLYIGQNKENLIFKGNDALFCLLTKEFCKAMEVVEVCWDENGRIFRKEILPILQFSDSFNTLYNEIKEEDTDYDENIAEKEDEEESKGDGKKKKSENFDIINDLSKLINYDSENQSRAIADNFLLGDVVFLKTRCKEKQLFKGGNDDLWLGNEGFFGEIWENLALIVELDYDLIKK